MPSFVSKLDLCREGDAGSSKIGLYTNILKKDSLKHLKQMGRGDSLMSCAEMQESVENCIKQHPFLISQRLVI
jgi:hypothetical protein